MLSPRANADAGPPPDAEEGGDERRNCAAARGDIGGASDDAVAHTNATAGSSSC